MSRPSENAAPITRIGAVNWDCSLPSSTYFGKYATRSLSPECYRDRTPYYAHLIAPDRIDYHDRTVAEYETEMRYAVEAGIDYFAYCWYDREPKTEHVENGLAAAVDAHVPELIRARMRHLLSPLREKLHLCAILITCHPYGDEELRALADAMRDPGYEKIGGRPLVWLFPGQWQPLIERLRKICREAGVPDPFAVLMTAGPNAVAPEDAAKVQAISAYACGATARTWEELCAANLAANEKRLESGLPCIPHFPMGWDPGPRILNPVPWCSYAEGPYAPVSSREQLLAGAREFKTWIAGHRAQCVPGHLLVFAWNEFEEGGWICPTLGADGRPDFARRDAFAEAAKIWRS